MGTIDNEVQKMVTKFKRQQSPLQLPYVWCALIGKFEKAGDIVGAIEVLKRPWETKTNNLDVQTYWESIP
jgi:hypothetical protein